ncbi:MAG: hypothetical protein HFF84_03055 [Oscillibacter sp.]|nr:hypothetical protein [Oscillibacter sp.]
MPDDGLRRPGEDDDALRQRALERLARLPASGNEDDYREWCGREESLTLLERMVPVCGALDLKEGKP